jgi:hypothetical protein
MKKLIFSVSFLFLVSMAFTSCTKCTTCSYTYKYVGKDSTRLYPEECGSSKELDNFRIKVNADAALNNGATVTCSENK